MIEALKASGLLLGLVIVWALIAAVAIGVGRMLRQRAASTPLTQEEWLRVAPVPAPGTLARARFNALPKDAAEARAMGIEAPPLDSPSPREQKPYPRPGPGEMDGPPRIEWIPGQARPRPAQVAEPSHDEQVALLRAELAQVPPTSVAAQQIRAELASMGEEVA